MQYSIVGNDIALIMHYRALLKRSDIYIGFKNKWSTYFFNAHDEGYLQLRGNSTW